MRMLAFAIFTLVLAMGLAMSRDAFKRRGSARIYALDHAGLAVLATVLAVAPSGPGALERFGLLAGLILVFMLGFGVSFLRAKGIQPRLLIVVHGSLALACYGWLAYQLFGP